MSSGSINVNGGLATISGNNFSTGPVTIGSGQLVVTGSSSVWTAPVSVGSGTLQVGNGGATGRLGSGVLTDNGAVVLDRNDAGLTLPLAIGGSGSLYQIGAGTATLLANNSYSGGTFINNGTLQVGNGGDAGSLGGGPVANNGNLLLNRSDAAFAVPNAISGTGDLYQVGGGTAVLSGSNSYTGPTNVVAGNLYLNNVNATTAIAVGPGTTLGGKGSARRAPSPSTTAAPSRPATTARAVWRWPAWSCRTRPP